MRFRRLCAFVLVVAFGFGAAVHGLLAAEMAAKMTVAAASEESHSSGCGACGGDGGMAPSDCTQMCAGFVAVMPADVPAAAPILETVPLGRAAGVTGRTGPPEPYPPKPL